MPRCSVCNQDVEDGEHDQHACRSAAATIATLGPGAPAVWDESTAEASAAYDAPKPRVLCGRYELGRRVGVGGFGVVHEARDRRLSKRVAVKLLSPISASVPDAVSRFQREAIAASQIGHKGIVDVTDFDRDADGTPFMVMEFIEGVELGRLLARVGALPPDRALAIALQIARALAAAHGKGILHRDLKPSNIFLIRVGDVEDFVKIVDFGVSKILYANDTQPNLTTQGQLMGTPTYMAPEQASPDGGVDGRADVYALGVLLWEMLAGRPPFVGQTPIAVIVQHVSAEAPAPSTVMTSLRELPQLDALVLRAMAKSPDHRFASMDEMADAIRAALDAQRPEEARSRLRPTPRTLETEPTEETSPVDEAAATVSATPASLQLGELLQPARKRRSALWFGVAAALVVAGVGVLGITARRDAAKDTAPAAVPSASAPTSPSVPAPAPTPAPTPTVVAPPAPSPQDDAVEIRLVIAPTGARVELDGIETRDNPLRLRRGDSYRLTVSAPDRKTERRELRAQASGELRIDLARASRDKPPRPKAKDVSDLMEKDL